MENMFTPHFVSYITKCCDVVWIMIGMRTVLYVTIRISVVLYVTYK